MPALCGREDPLLPDIPHLHAREDPLLPDMDFSLPTPCGTGRFAAGGTPRNAFHTPRAASAVRLT